MRANWHEAEREEKLRILLKNRRAIFYYMPLRGHNLCRLNFTLPPVEQTNTLKIHLLIDVLIERHHKRPTNVYKKTNTRHRIFSINQLTLVCVTREIMKI